MVDRWIQLGYAAKFDEANIPNKKNIRAILNDVGYDQGRHYSLTWQSGFAGFGWNTEKIKKGVHTIDDLFAKKIRVGLWCSLSYATPWELLCNIKA